MTITSQPAKLRVPDKRYIQADLVFLDTVTIISQRNKDFCESNWTVTTKTYKQLFNEYLSSNNESTVSLGMIMALKPFYIRSATSNDIEMCCCKKHLHARWSINALIDCAKEQNLDLGMLIHMKHFLTF